jgi:Ran GTPase-activating protein (RanGAP) involved in mRNA processing and transport
MDMMDASTTDDDSEAEDLELQLTWSSDAEYILSYWDNFDWSFPWLSLDSEPIYSELCGASVYAYCLVRNFSAMIIFAIVVLGQLSFFFYLILNVSSENAKEEEVPPSGVILGMLILFLAIGQHFIRGVQLVILSSCSCSKKSSGPLTHGWELFLLGSTNILVAVFGFVCGYVYGMAVSENSPEFITNTIAILFVEQFDENAFLIVMYLSPNWHRAQVKKLTALDCLLSVGRANKMPITGVRKILEWKLLYFEKGLNRLRANDATFTKVSLPWMGLDDKDSIALVQHLAIALEDNTTLTGLNVRSNNICDEGAKALADALKHNTTLASLNVEDNNIGAKGAAELADALRYNRALTYLNLEGNDIGDDGAAALADALKVNTTLAWLNVKGNNIGVDGAKALADALKHNTTLTSLRVIGNNIGDDGAKALADALMDNLTLTYLNVGRNNIGDEGAKALADALKENRRLASLNVKGNHIGVEGTKVLATALLYNRRLTSLNVEGNDIGDDGAAALADALRFNRTLAHLNVEGNNIDDEGVKALTAALSFNTTLHDPYPLVVVAHPNCCSTTMHNIV